MLSLTESVWDFQNDALWDTHQHALLHQKLSDSIYITGRSTLYGLHLSYDIMMTTM